MTNTSNENNTTKGMIGVAPGSNIDTSSLPLMVMLNAKSESKSINWAKLQQALRDIGFPEAALPPDIKPKSALSRVMVDYRSKDLACDKLVGGIFGYQVTDKRPSTDGTALEYVPSFSLYFDDHGRLQQSHAHIGLSQQMVAQFKRNLEESTLAALKVWLQRRIVDRGGVKIADNGHVYFLPFEVRAKFETLAAVLTEHTPLAVGRIPIGTSDQLAEVIIGGLTNEVGKILKEADDKIHDESVGSRALDTQVQRLKSQFERLEKYEELLSVSLDDLKQRTVETKRTMTSALIARKAVEQEERDAREAAKKAKAAQK